MTNGTNVPILYNHEIDEYAHAVLGDYKPKLLREPGIINFEYFLESYLGVTLEFRDLYYEKDEGQIYARTIFRKGAVKIFDRENERVAYPLFSANTIIIDNYVMQSGREGMAMFTGLHEGGHFLLHSKVYETFRSGQVCCRRKSIENFGMGNTQQTPAQWLEHQANYFASSLAMPNATFVPFVNAFLREQGIYKRYIVLGEDDDLDIVAKDLLPEYISEVYGVSKQAASIKLKKNGFIGGNTNKSN